MFRKSRLARTESHEQRDQIHALAGTSAALRVAAGAPVPADVAARLTRRRARARALTAAAGSAASRWPRPFPPLRVLGLDRDPAAVARRRASGPGTSGLDGRVPFAVTGAARLPAVSGLRSAAARAISAREDALQILNALRNAAGPGRCLPAGRARRRRRAGAGRVGSGLGALARRAGFATCELTCREPDLDVYELRR